MLRVSCITHPCSCGCSVPEFWQPAIFITCETPFILEISYIPRRQVTINNDNTLHYPPHQKYPPSYAKLNRSQPVISRFSKYTGELIDRRIPSKAERFVVGVFLPSRDPEESIGSDGRNISVYGVFILRDGLFPLYCYQQTI
jgi:hypothetical protein